MKKRVLALLTAFAILSSMIPTALAAENAEQKPLKLQYDEPAPYKPSEAIDSSYNHNGWERWALPLGNGHMGAMIFGGTDTERIQLNEKTLWSGGPGGTTEGVVANKDPQSDVFGNVDAYGSGAMEKYIEQCFTDYYNNAYTGAPAQSGEMKILPNHRLGLGTYTNFAELFLDLNHEGASDYNRELDLRTGLSTVTHTYNGVDYTRETFASYPDNVIVYRLAASEKGAVDVTVRAEIPYNHTAGQVDQGDRGNDGREGTVTADLENKTLHMDGVMDNEMTFSGDFHVIPQGGTMTVTGDEENQFRIEDADSVMIVVALATNYKNEYPEYRQDDPEYSRKDVEARIAAVDGKSFEELYETHYEDYNELFSRVELDLGGTYNPDETTDQLLSTWKTASSKGNQDHYLEELYFQYGRYMLIASSREDSLPANLQGIWADQKRPQWQSDYHTNINLQMNYWPAYTTNLAETGEALIAYVDSLQEPGAITAKMLYGVDDTWMVNCSANALGFTGNINSAASLASTANAFILQNIYDAYEFTQDQALLENTIYPMMKSACKLFTETLQPGRTELDQDRLFWAPSYSSEQGQTWTVGAAFDQQLIYMLFADTVDAANILGVDADFVAQLEDMMARLHPVEIGLDGQIKEYQQEGKYLTDIHTGKQIPGTDKAHRHNSQLMVVHPGDLVTTETPEYMEAAKTTLNLRGDGATGWSMGQKFNMWARLHDGNHAYDKLFVNLMKNGTATNLFDLHPPFQIDGNFGGTAGIAELLMQSHAGYVDILPALPDALSSGSVTGLVAEGNFVVDMTWADMQLTSLDITSRSGGTLNVKAGAVSQIVDMTTGKEITAVTHNEDGSIGFATEQGHTYSFVFGAADLTGLAEKTAEFDTYSSYAYTGDTAAFDTLLTTTRRIVEQGHCYIPTVGELAGQLDTAFAALTARESDEYGAVLSLRLKDKVEAAGISTENQNAYRVYGTPVIEATETMLDSEATAAEMRAQGLTLVQTLEEYGKLASRTELYGLLVDLQTAELDSDAIDAAIAQAELVFLDVDATDEALSEAADALRQAAEGVVDFFHVQTVAQTGGSISPVLDGDVLGGTDLTVTITPDNGYAILDVLVNGHSVGRVDTYTVEDLHEDTVIEAKFYAVITDTDEASALLDTAIALAESLNADDYADFAAVEAALQEAKAAMEAEDVVKVEKANDLLSAVDALQRVSTLLGKVEAESQGLNVAWDDSWASDKSGAPEEDDVKALIDAFRADGKTIIVGYGENGKTHSKGPGSTNMQWEIDRQSKFSGGGQMTSRAKDPWISFTFTGDRIELITERALTGCVADVYIDGQLITRLDLSSTNGNGIQQDLVFDSADYDASKNLTDSEHTILVWAKGVGVESASQAPYQILRMDAFNVYGIPDMVAKTGLATSIAKAKAVDRDLYDQDSVATLEEKLAAAEEVLLNANATASDVLFAGGALDDAYKALGRAERTVTAVTDPAPITVEIGTSAADLSLPESVTVSAVEKSTQTTVETIFPVEWDLSTYNALQAGTQVLRGRLILPDTGVYENPDEIVAQITVTVRLPGAQAYTLRSQAGEGGSISPRGVYEMETGMSKTFTITPDEGYEIFDVTVNGKSVGAVTTWTVANLTEDTTIEATFQPVTETSSGALLLQHALTLAENLQEADYTAETWKAVAEAVTAAEAAQSSTDAEMTQAANDLLAAIQALKLPDERYIEAESEGVNVAWDDSWESGRSGLPEEDDVAAMIDGFRADGKTIIVGYGQYGKTHSKTDGSTNMQWEIQEDDRMSDGAQMISRAKDPWLEFTFRGNRLELITEMAQTACMADVYIDGQKIITLDLSTTDKNGFQQKLVLDSADYTELSAGTHTFMIHAVGVGTESAAGAPYQILRVDAFRVYGDVAMADRTELAAAVAQAETLNALDYTEESWTAFAAARSNAVTVLESPNAEQSAVDAALQQLQDTAAQLVFRSETITAVVPSADITVAVGTAFEQLPLPETVVFTTASSAYRCTVTWQNDGYDGTTAGVYTLYGTIAPEGDRFENAENLRAEIRVTVSDRVENILLSESELSIAVDDSERLTAAVVPENALNSDVYWTSTNPEIATVEDGVVTALKEGTTTIIATSADSGVSASCLVTVHTPAVSTSYLIKAKQSEGGTINPSSARVTRGGDKTFTITPDDGYAIADVLVDGKSVGKVSTYTFENVKSAHTITAEFEKVGTEPGTVAGFTDVKTNDWFAEAVQYVVENKLMNGVAEDKFAPNSATTRGMIVTILYREAGSPAVESDDASWWSDARVWAVEQKISDGTNMEGTITREQLAAMLYRYAGSPAVSNEITGFSDVANISDWASDAMKWAVSEGILNGSNGKLNPQGNATRAEVAAMLMRFCENEA